ncbi:MAG: MlaE family lipid ABC transporter permease subunit [Sulfurimonas sp.]|nr:MlaE family lipid ABC transporter permease subunit [Sulfurimonas sp.]
MTTSFLTINNINNKLTLNFSGEFTVYLVTKYQKQIESIDLSKIESVFIDFSALEFLDTAAAIFIHTLQKKFQSRNIQNSLICHKQEILESLELVKKEKQAAGKIPHAPKQSYLEIIGKVTHKNFMGLLSFLSFLGEMFHTHAQSLKSIKDIRFKEIAFEMNESAIKALGIVALTSFLIGLVVAYQSAYQLKLYGANIFIVDMLGISILRELAPLITAIVVAGRSGSAFTAQIGAMKITQELDAMRTMGFDPYAFLVLPRILALMIAMPILIFVSDIMGVLGGMLVANLDLQITPELFLDRFQDVVAAKHFFIGIAKGPFFAFLIATIGIYRGLMVKDDTQSIGFNTTKSVVESIFAVIVCDAIFSIAFTNLKI